VPKEKTTPNISVINFILDLPEAIIRVVFRQIVSLFFSKKPGHEKIHSLSLTAGKIEAHHKGLRIISIEILDGFSVYHGVSPKNIADAKLNRIRTGIAKALVNDNVFVTIENNNPRFLKVVIQS
jgi:hypothetical protein